jgi:hypothetical protein
MNGTNYNSPCSFAEKTVEYIYDEMNGETKAEFETHLAKCNSCADELAGFGIVRSQVADWKLKEFSPMTTPLIELPIVQTVENTQVKRGWFESFRNLAMLSPAWMTQTAAFAALAICVGLGLYIFTSNKKVDNTLIADGNTKPMVNSTPPVKTTPTPKVEVIESTSKSATIQPSKPTIDVVKPITPRKAVVQAIQTEPKKTVVDPPTKSKRVVKSVPTLKRTNVELPVNDVEEDDSLRLSDLFDEVSIK